MTDTPADKPQIAYDDFAKLDIRIGHITSAEIIEGADKLFRLSVDFAEQNEDGTPKMRQIVSGIRPYFATPEELIGRYAPFVVNLEPRTIRGFESQGMILAASAGDAFALLAPHAPVPPGTLIK